MRYLIIITALCAACSNSGTELEYDVTNGFDGLAFGTSQHTVDGSWTLISTDDRNGARFNKKHDRDSQYFFSKDGYYRGLKLSTEDGEAVIERFSREYGPADAFVEKDGKIRTTACWLGQKTILCVLSGPLTEDKRSALRVTSKKHAPNDIWEDEFSVFED